MEQERNEELDQLIQDTRELISPQQAEYTPPAPPPASDTLAAAHAGGKKKRGCRGCLIALMIFLLLVIAAMVVGWKLFTRKPTGETEPSRPNAISFVTQSPADNTGNQTPTSYTRKRGAATVLLAGLDDDGIRTDTMMLFFVDQSTGEAGLLSLPRDTLVSGGYSVPKLNSAYGWAGCGEDGIRELMDRVEELVGYRPDSYLCIRMQTLVDAVDTMGGVSFDVPMDMYYEDPWQDLVIDLKAGPQLLDGQQSIGLLRFRSGYAMADLQRIQVQRDFVKAAGRQWLSLTNVGKLTKVMQLIQDQALTDLDSSNLFWLAQALLGGGMDNACMETLPGAGADLPSGSYYVADPQQVLALINASFNIYEQDLTADMLHIRTQ